MKLFNNKKSKTVKFEKLEKKQLSKVIGGVDTTVTPAPIQDGKKGLNAVNVKLA